MGDQSYAIQEAKDLNTLPLEESQEIEDHSSQVHSQR